MRTFGKIIGAIFRPTRHDRLLDLLSVSIAGLRDGVGPLLTVFLIQDTLLNPAQISWVLAAPAFAALAGQIPVGLLFDGGGSKKLLIAFGAGTLGLIALAISHLTSFPSLLAAQACLGFATCILSVGIPALSVALIRKDQFGRRIARNEICSKIGNFGALGAAGFLAHAYGVRSVFGVSALFALAVVIVCVSARDRAEGTALTVVRTGQDDSAKAEQGSLGARIVGSLRDPRYFGLLVSCLLLQVTNAPLFMIFEQIYVRQNPANGAAQISVALILTQIVIALGSFWLAGKKIGENIFSYFAVAFALIGGRAILFATSTTIAALWLGQILDGAIAAVIILLPMRAILSFRKADFNLRASLVGVTVSLGASVSMVAAGYLIKFGSPRIAALAFGVTALGSIPVALFFPWHSGARRFSFGDGRLALRGSPTQFVN